MTVKFIPLSSIRWIDMHGCQRISYVSDTQVQSYECLDTKITDFFPQWLISYILTLTMLDISNPEILRESHML